MQVLEIKNDRRKAQRRKGDRRTNKLDPLFHHAVHKGVFLDTRKRERRKPGDRRREFDPKVHLN
jgi:hypothetical protein